MSSWASKWKVEEKLRSAKKIIWEHHLENEYTLVGFTAVGMHIFYSAVRQSFIICRRSYFGEVCKFCSFCFYSCSGHMLAQMPVGVYRTSVTFYPRSYGNPMTVVHFIFYQAMLEILQNGFYVTCWWQWCSKCCAVTACSAKSVCLIV